jgi:hypothetical protein
MELRYKIVACGELGDEKAIRRLVVSSTARGRSSPLCHLERSIAIGFTDRNAQSRDLLFASAKQQVPFGFAQGRLSTTKIVRLGRTIFFARDDRVEMINGLSG